MKKFKYIDRDSGELYYGDVAISDVPNLNDKIVNYDSHIADTVKHITSAERALWNSNSGGLKPFTNCFYVDANFTNSAPYFNNLTDAINSATNTTLIVVNGTFTFPATLSKTVSIVGNQKSLINFNSSLTSSSILNIYNCAVNATAPIVVQSLNLYGSGVESGFLTSIDVLNASNYSYLSLSQGARSGTIENCDTVYFYRTTISVFTFNKINSLFASFIFNNPVGAEIKILNIKKEWRCYSGSNPRLFYSPLSSSVNYDSLKCRDINLIYADGATSPIIQIGDAGSIAASYCASFLNCKFLAKSPNTDTRLLKIYSSSVTPLSNCWLCMDLIDNYTLCEGTTLLLKNVYGSGTIANTTTGDTFLNDANYRFLRLWERL